MYSSRCASPLSIDGITFGVVTWSTSRISMVQVRQTVLDRYKGEENGKTKNIVFREVVIWLVLYCHMLPTCCRLWILSNVRVSWRHFWMNQGPVIMLEGKMTLQPTEDRSRPSHRASTMLQYKLAWMMCWLRNHSRCECSEVAQESTIYSWNKKPAQK